MTVDQDENINEFWNKCKEIFKETARETIGIRRYKIKPWMTKNT